MPSIDVEPNHGMQHNLEEPTPTSLPVIGIIYPPPEVRNIVDKTASFVARNGPEFESRIKNAEKNNSKFNFLNPGDPYNAYYQHKVKEIREGKNQEVTPVVNRVTSTTQQRQQDLLKQAQVQEQPFVPKDPPPEFEFIADPPSISAFDLDVVKLTAQFVAKNGRQFLTELMDRETRNYQFDFLRPQHSLFKYFTKILEQYTMILLPPSDMMKRLELEATDKSIVLEQVRYRSNWQKYQEAQRRKEEMIIEKERIAYAQIDWHDFVVVETVDYQIGESGDFPPPTTPDDVGNRVLMQDRQASINENKERRAQQTNNSDDEMQMDSDDEMTDLTNIGRQVEQDMNRREEIRIGETKDNTQVQDMDEESSDSDSETPSKYPSGVPLVTHPHLNPFQVPGVVIKKDYDPKAPKAPTSQHAPHEVISPFTRTPIPVEKAGEHVRYNLIDPRWVEQRDQVHNIRNEDPVFAQGPNIQENLKKLAERRTDIFGTGIEETGIGKKIGEEDVRRDDKHTWDGHTSSVEKATRAARENISIEDQIHQIHKVQGLVHDDEKEKIGPKPSGDTISAPPMRNPNPPGSVLTSSNPPPMMMPPNMNVVSVQPPQMPPQVRPPPPPQMPQPPPSQMPPQQQQMPPQPPNLMATMMMQGTNMPPMPPMMVPTPPQQRAFPLIPASNSMQQFIPGQQNIPGMQQPMKHGMMDKPDDEPMMKRTRTEDSLEPEHLFLAKHRGVNVTFKVIVPNMPEKTEWTTGQDLELHLPLEDFVSSIKAKVQEMTNMPPGKQKLNFEGLFLKDSNTLAYYNISPGTVLHLQLKERGGRKK